MKVEITLKQAMQFNQMLATLKRIKAYQSPDKLRKESEKDWPRLRRGNRNGLRKHTRRG